MNENIIKNKLNQINRTRKWLNQGNYIEFERPVVEEIGNSNWYKQIDAPITFDSLTNTIDSELENGKHVYFSYKEQNTNFAIKPSISILNLQPGQSYHASIMGKKDKTLNITMFVIFYKDGIRFAEKVIPFNEITTISLVEGADGIRLAIKVSGSGQFKLDSIQIEDIALWSNTTSNSNTNNHNFLPINKTNWYIPNHKKVSIDAEGSSFSINLDKGEHIYLPYKEANLNFTYAPQNPIEIKDNKTLSFLFEGEKEAQLDVKLFSVFYNKKNERIDTQQIDLNSKRLVKPAPEAKNMRLAIRVQGNGNFKLSSVAISGEGFWLAKRVDTQITSYPKYDYMFKIDKSSLFGLFSDNKILVHNDIECFESKLTSKQTKYLPCLDNVELNAAPKESALVPKPKHYYDVYPSVDSVGSVNLTLFISSYKNGKRINLKQVPFNQPSIISFSEETTDVKFFIRVNGPGTFENIRLNINEKEIEVTNQLALDLNKGQWYPSNKFVTLKNEDNALVAVSTATSEQRSYVSYKELNNSYNTPPVSLLLPINRDAIYEFNLKASVSDDIQFIPMVIEYAGEKKLEVYQLKVNTTFVTRFHPDTTDIRVAFRIGGPGTVKLEDFSIKEMFVLQDTNSTDFINNQEPYQLDLVKPKPLKQLKMAVIFDEFTTASYAEECELITFTPENWLETLTSNKPDMLMVESAWVGNNGSWNKLVGYYGEENMKPLFSLIKWCNENSIPTVFWNKEDPVHYNRFIKTAIKFDYIFTTDENMVDNYKELAGHENVFALPFAAQPAIHNPIKIVDERENKACFAGSYYRHHEERAKDMDRVLDYAAKYGLDIYDRNYEKNLKGLMPNHVFPERFKENIKGSLRYYEIDKAYKGYKVMININTVKNSPTMFSRRVFEGLACGTPVVSTYAKGIENIFGDLVTISENEQEIDLAFQTLLNDENEYRKKSMAGIRDVLSKHTYTQRLKYVCELVGIPVKYELPKVTVISLIHSKDEFFRVLEQFNHQEYDNKELYMLVDTFDGYLELFQQYNTKSVKTFIRSYMSHYQNIREWINSPYITYFDKYDYYGKHYLSDLMLSTTFTDSDFIGKNSHYYFEESSQSVKEVNDEAEYEFVTSLKPASTIVKTEVFTKDSLEKVFEKLENGTDYSSYLKYGKKFFSNDKFNYLSNAFGNMQDELKNKIFDQIQL